MPDPFRSWADMGEFLNDQVMENIRSMGFKKPTPIQMQAIAVGCRFRDMLALAPTGSGKSAAFLLPIISFLLKMPSVSGQVAEDGPYGIIMAPTRELAQQIDVEFKNLA